MRGKKIKRFIGILFAMALLFTVLLTPEVATGEAVNLLSSEYVASMEFPANAYLANSSTGVNFPITAFTTPSLDAVLAEKPGSGGTPWILYWGALSTDIIFNEDVFVTDVNYLLHFQTWFGDEVMTIQLLDESGSVIAAENMTKSGAIGGWTDGTFVYHSDTGVTAREIVMTLTTSGTGQKWAYDLNIAGDSTPGGGAAPKGNVLLSEYIESLEFTGNAYTGSNLDVGNIPFITESTNPSVSAVLAEKPGSGGNPWLKFWGNLYTGVTFKEDVLVTDVSYLLHFEAWNENEAMTISFYDAGGILIAAEPMVKTGAVGGWTSGAFSFSSEDGILARKIVFTFTNLSGGQKWAYDLTIENNSAGSGDEPGPYDENPGEDEFYLPPASGDSVSLLDLTVTDPAPYKVHVPGAVFAAQASATMQVGEDLKNQVDTMTVYAPGTTNVQYKGVARDQNNWPAMSAELKAALLDGSPYSNNLTQLWIGGTAQYCYVRVDLAQLCQITSLTLSHTPHNGWNGPSSVDAIFFHDNGTTETHSLTLNRLPNSDVAPNTYYGTGKFATEDPIVAKAIVFRMMVPSGIDVEEITIVGASQVTSSLKAPDPELTYQWVDWQHNALTAPVLIDKADLGDFTVYSPADLPIGYVGLKIWPDNPQVTYPLYLPNEHKEFGFAILDELAPGAEWGPDLANNYGFTHSPVDDPYLGGCDKNSTWSASASGMQASAQSVWDKGFWQMPLATGDPWTTSNETAGNPVTDTQLNNLRERARICAEADLIPVWEFGIEENLGSYFQNYTNGYGGRTQSDIYWDNLAKKLAAIHEGFALAGNPNAKIIYQIAEPIGRYSDVEFFFAHPDVVGQVDILSLHPYAWSDFKDPEWWAISNGGVGLADMMNDIYALMHAKGFNIPIWFTEVGAPHHGQYPGGYFGYNLTNESGNTVVGLTLREMAPYLAKLEAIGLNQGVGMMSWYCYRDPGSDRRYPEHYFGLVDVNGFPKPGYPAYITSQNHLMTKTPVGMFNVGDVVVSKFTDGAEDTYVIWKEAAANPDITGSYGNYRPYDGFGETMISLAALGIEGVAKSICNTVGTPMDASVSEVSVGWDPIYIIADANTDLAAAVEPFETPDGYVVDLGAAYRLTGTRLVFEKHGATLIDSELYALGYTVEVSLDGNIWQTIADKLGNNIPGYIYDDLLNGQVARYLRVASVCVVDPENAPAFDRLLVFGAAPYITVNGIDLIYTYEDGAAKLIIDDEQMADILAASGSEIVFDFSGYGAVDLYVSAGLFKDVDKTITIITDNGSSSVNTKSLWNNSGKNRLITVRNNKLDFKNV